MYVDLDAWISLEMESSPLRSAANTELGICLKDLEEEVVHSGYKLIAHLAWSALEIA